MRFPGVAIIMGDIRTGKSGVAHEIARQFHEQANTPAVLHLPTLSTSDRGRIQRMLPKWLKVTTERSQWPERHVVIYDEASLTAHSRRSQSADAIDLDECMSIAGQREQLIVFISHHSRKLDVNACTAVHRIIWKRPTFAQMLWERDEMADFTMKAYDFFIKLRGGEIAQRKTNLILNMDKFGFMQCQNELPKWWNNQISTAFKTIQQKDALKGGVFK